MNLPPIRTDPSHDVNAPFHVNSSQRHLFNPPGDQSQRSYHWRQGHSSSERAISPGIQNGPGLLPFLRPTFDWHTDTELVPSYGNTPTTSSQSEDWLAHSGHRAPGNLIRPHSRFQGTRPKCENPDNGRPSMNDPSPNSVGSRISPRALTPVETYPSGSKWEMSQRGHVSPKIEQSPDLLASTSNNRIRERSRNNTEDERYLLLSYDHWVSNIRPDKVWCRGCEGDIELDDREHQRYYTSGYTKHRKTCAGRILKIEVLCEKLRRHEGFPYAYNSVEIEDQYWKDEWSSYMKDFYLHARNSTPPRDEPLWLRINREAALLTIPTLEKRNVRVFYDDRVYVKGSYTRGWVPNVDKVAS